MTMFSNHCVISVISVVSVVPGLGMLVLWLGAASLLDGKKSAVQT